MNSDLPGCARCPIEARDRLCQKEDGKSPNFCPTMNNKEAISNALNELKKPDVLKYSNAPCTALAAKDRLLGHNPLAAIYTIDSYYRSLKQ